MIPNMNYQNLKESYLFYNIAQKTKAYLEAHPGAHLYSCLLYTSPSPRD